MKTTIILPPECRQEIEDRLQEVMAHWKKDGTFLTNAFAGWVYGLQWVLGTQGAEIAENPHQCERQHAWGPLDFCLVCGKKHPLENPQLKLTYKTEQDQLKGECQECPLELKCTNQDLYKAGSTPCPFKLDEPSIRSEDSGGE